MIKTVCTFLCLLSAQFLFAHNGALACAYPIANIKIDGRLSDWPSGLAKYYIRTPLSDDRPTNDADFSGFFQVGYNLANRSLYIAFTITDDSFVEDTSASVQFNTQDCLELCIDARHLPNKSGVASFMYSKKLRNINKAYYDSFARNADWSMMEVAMLRQGNKRYYEWRIMLGDQLSVGKSLGFDFMVFDKDADQSFTFSGWGKGGSKFMLPGSLGDILILPAGQQLATIGGKVSWDKPVKEKLPEQIRLRALAYPALWMQAELDTLGNYKLSAPVGEYAVMLPDEYIQADGGVYVTRQKVPCHVNSKAGKISIAPPITLSTETEPDLLPAKGILHNFSQADAGQLDNFIQTYQQYYGIPGVSLALIKDGRLTYYKTYGVKNSFTGEEVDSTTLFEAASVTKPVFAFAVERLAERGIIDLDKPLYLYLPYPDIEYDERYKLITARHVLTHRTGFPNWRWMNDDGKLNLKFTPGTKYGYSGEGFEYLRAVVEKITGKKVEEVLQEEVIVPMALYHTFFSRNDSLKRMVANGHFNMLPVRDELPAEPRMAYSMHTEAKIFTRFMLYLLEQKGLSSQSYETMLSKQSEFDFEPGEEKPKIPAYMGISLEIRETPFGKSFGHSGNNGDFKCRFEVYKDLKMGYVIFTNSNTSDQLLAVLRKYLVEGKD